MITNEKTHKQLLAERDFLNALIECLRECTPGQDSAAVLPATSGKTNSAPRRKNLRKDN